LKVYCFGKSKSSSFDKSLIDLTYNVTDYLKAFINAVDTNDSIELNEADILGKIGASVVCVETGLAISRKKLSLHLRRQSIKQKIANRKVV
jgi:hypothetical protein